MNPTNTCLSESSGGKVKRKNFHRVPVWKKLAYAVGSMPYSMCTTVIGLYFSIFLLEVVILDPIFVLIIVFSGRVWDAITDPLVGYLITFTRTRFGRLRPWMAAAIFPTAVLYFLLWFVPLESSTDGVRFIYYLLCYLAFNSFLTCLHVPYTSLTMHLSDDNKERDSVTFYRACFEMTGTVLAVSIYTTWYVGLVHSTDTDCDSQGRRLSDHNLKAAYQWHAATVAVLVVVCGVITVVSIKEQQGEPRRVIFLKELRNTLGFRPFFYLLMLNICSWLGFQFLQGNIALYIKYSAGLEDQYPFIIAVVLITAIPWTIFWQRFIMYLGKKTGFVVGMWAVMPILISLLFVTYFPMGSYVVAVFVAMGLSCAYLIPWSMLPDVIDEATLKSSVQREEMFYAFFVFGNKLAGGMTLAISTAVYKIAGYNKNACKQPWYLPLTLKLLVTVPPIFFILLSLLFHWHYPITEASREKTKLFLVNKRIQEASLKSAGNEDTKVMG